MSAKRKTKKEPVGVLTFSDAMTELYWEILRNMEDYRKDYKKYKLNPKDKHLWLAKKWSLLEPIDPFLTYKEIKSDYKTHYFFPGGKPLIPVQSKVIFKTPDNMKIELDLDLRCDKKSLIEEIGREIHKIADLNHFREARVNLFGRRNKIKDEDYMDLLLVYKHSSLKNRDKKEPKLTKEDTENINSIRKKLRRKKTIKELNYGTIRGKFRTLETIINKFPVPIKSKS
jgi:hypothetical protein